MPGLVAENVFLTRHCVKPLDSRGWSGSNYLEDAFSLILVQSAGYRSILPVEVCGREIG